ncbi:angiopoietin-2-like [Bufo gargarizans]|uniref:angiopoietin-2-like n=1 Tax=Bufo gargarizans TaxID=30331 RepID=UPI001CF31D52|nr:angiopoietin-2-like [Bufo gargarizans]
MGAHTSSMLLLVLIFLGVQQGSEGIRNIGSRTLVEGDQLSLQCDTTTGPNRKNTRLQFTFYKDGQKVLTPTTSSNYEVQSVHLEDSGNYHCKISTASNTVVKSSAKISVVIRELFSSVDINVTQSPVVEGHQSTVTCYTSLHPDRQNTELQYAFYRDNKEVQGFGSSNKYEILSARLEDSGIYYCEVETSDKTVRKRSDILTVLVIGFLHFKDQNHEIHETFRMSLIMESLFPSNFVTGSISRYDCSDIWQQNNLTTSGIYMIKPKEAEFSFPVYCEMSLNGGWTLIQKHNGVDGLSFEKTWEEYENGFGDLQGEHWLGLKYIYALTNQIGKPSKLHISIGDFGDQEAYARYDSFVIANASSYYKLLAGNYSGTAGDAFLGNGRNGTNQHSSAFSTEDLPNDNCHPLCVLGDIMYLSCSEQFSAGWWFNACGSANLNGVWRSPPRYKRWVSSVSWPTWRLGESLKFSQMYVIHQ